MWRELQWLLRFLPRPWPDLVSDLRFRVVGEGRGATLGVANAFPPFTARCVSVCFGPLSYALRGRYYHAWPVWYPGRVGN